MQQILFVHDFQESPLPRKNYLEMSGFEVTLLHNGDDCLKSLALARPALVLMDVLLEGKNGFEVCRAIRERCTAAEVPVILCSHIYRSRIYRDEAVAAGAQRFLLLPMKLDELLAHVTELASATSKPR
jgi:two-component system sensor histidine kinase/response regulator